ncbi:hypothetical protein LJC74_00025 [Eubacteriales bacterium OttesenSCG-928-A19]|nr:hypothetical protein [Eubacteriales bacterium OttesenSCG-928-A19]
MQNDEKCGLTMYNRDGKMSSIHYAKALKEDDYEEVVGLPDGVDDAGANDCPWRDGG